MKMRYAYILTGLLLLGWTNIYAKNVAMTYDTYFGRRGRDTNAIYNSMPDRPHSDESGWMRKDANANRLYSATPIFKRSDLTSYAIYSGENGNATKTVFRFTADSIYTLFYVYYRSELLYAKSGHASVYISFCLMDGTDTIGRAFRKDFRLMEDTLGTNFRIIDISETGGRMGYIDWQAQAFDLSQYRGRNLTIVAEATCCSNLECRSNLSLAFQKECIVQGACDGFFPIPSYTHPTWHRGTVFGPIFSHQDSLPVPDTVGYYTCVLDNPNSDNLLFASAPFCPCREPVQYIKSDTIVPYANLPVQWHGFTFTGDQSTHIDTISTQFGCDSIIHTYSMEYTYSLSIYQDGVLQPQIYDGLFAGDRIVVKMDPLNEVTFFSHWNDSSTLNPRTFVITSDTVFTAYYQKICPAKQTIALDTIVCDTLMPYTWRGHRFEDIGEMRDTIQSIWKCDSIEYVYRLDTVHCEPPCEKNLVYRKWQDFLFCDNKELDFVTYQWLRDGEKILGENSQYLFIAEGFEPTSVYQVIIKRRDGTSFITCPTTFTRTTASASTYGAVSAIPGRRGWIRVSVPTDDAKLTIWNVMGCLIREETIVYETEIYLPTSGTYIITLKDSYRESVHKIMQMN